MKKISKILFLGCIPCLGGCTILGFLLSPSASEQKIAATFPLTDYQNERLFLAIRGTRASGVDADVPELLARSVENEFTRKVHWEPERILSENQTNPNVSLEYSWSRLEQEARQAGAKFLLYVEIIDYEMVPLHKQEYYMGKLATRSVLMDTETGAVLWPAEESGRIVRTAVEFEKEGREETLWRLTTATAHCIVREFYNCLQSDYSIGEEVKSWDRLLKDLD